LGGAENKQHAFLVHAGSVYTICDQFSFLFLVHVLQPKSIPACAFQQTVLLKLSIPPTEEEIAAGALVCRFV
jgi:hypothetical protein